MSYFLENVYIFRIVFQNIIYWNTKKYFHYSNIAFCT